MVAGVHGNTWRSLFCSPRFTPKLIHLCLSPFVVRFTPQDMQEVHTMLVLTRRISEKLIIGENVEITIVRIDGGQVRIGINAPKDVPIRRAELAELSESEKIKARKPPLAAKKKRDEITSPISMPVLNPFMTFG